MTFIPPKKKLEPSLNWVLELMNPASYIVKVAGHHLNDRIFEMHKEKRQYDFSSTSHILKGLQTHKELEFESETIVELVNEGKVIYAKGKSILINSIAYRGEPEEKVFSGSIYSFATCLDLVDFTGKYHRMIIPLNKEGFNIHSFQRRYFEPRPKAIHYFIPINVSSDEYHLYNYKLADSFYLIIDSIQPSDLNSFQKKCFNVLLALGFVKGDLIHDECYILSFSNVEMSNPENVLYHSMRASVKTNQATFTSNPFSVYGDTDFERGDDLAIKSEVREKLYEDIYDFPLEAFSKLVTLFYEKEKLQRAALLFISGHTTSLEMRIPNYYVAIEAITAYISNELATHKTSLNPIKDNILANTIIQNFIDQIKEMQKEKLYPEEDFNVSILEKKLRTLNAPTNKDKLSESFTFFKYQLSEEQKQILKDRNSFLHGSFLKTIDDDTNFREALHVSLRLHFMIAFLLMKIAGFNGKIINYAELWSHITGLKLNEERLVKI